MSAGRVARWFAPFLCLGIVASVDSAASSTCKALVSLDDRWYVSDEAGTLSAPFNSGTARAFGVALSDDGEHVAYLQGEGDGSAEFFIAGKSAEPYRFVEEMDSGARSPDVRWMSADVIRTEMGYHVMPAFKFYRVDYGNGMIRLAPTLRPDSELLSNAGSGLSCVPNPQATKVACIYADGVEVDGKPVHADNPFAEVVDRFDMKFGEWHRIRNMEEPDEAPGLVDISAVRAVHEHGQIHVAIRYGDPTVEGHGEGGYMRPPAPIAFTSLDHLVGVSVSTDSKRKMLSVEVRRRAEDVPPLDTALAWLPDGQELAFVKHTSEGSLLMVMKQDAAKKWTKSGAYPFMRSGPAYSMRFLDDSTLFVESDGHATLYSLTRRLHPGGPEKGLRLVRALPSEIEVKGENGPVSLTPITWACR